MAKVSGKQGGQQEEPSSTEQPTVVTPRRKRPIPRSVMPQKARYDFSDLKDADPGAVAYRYADLGWQLVPVDRLTGKPVLGVGGPTRDLPTVSDWLDDPDVTIGVATGQGSRIVALKITGKKGQRTLRTLFAGRTTYDTLEGWAAPSTYLFFQAPADKIPTRKEVAPGVDYLGERAYFVPSAGFWSPSCTDLAPLPDRLLDLVSGAAPLGIPEQVAAGDFAALNEATTFDAAQAYSARGWKLVPVTDTGESMATPGEGYLPKDWEQAPGMGLGIKMGFDSGVVGLWIEDNSRLGALEGKFGPLPLPRIVGKGILHFFRAPAERFPFKGLFGGIEYFGDGESLPAPPSVFGERKLHWEVSPDFSPNLPELPEWLHTLLAEPSRITAAVQQQPLSSPPVPQGTNRSRAAQAVTAALSYAARGWLVFPLRPGDKLPLVKNWQNVASRNRETISRWWQGKRSNIAIVTGAKSGIVVLDVDVKNNQPGLQSLTELEVVHGQLETLRATTASGGLHLFFRHPGQKVGNRAGLLPGLDFRGDGGYVVAAPSRVGGQEYRWVNPSVPVAEMPGWLLTLVTTRHSVTGKGATSAPQDRLTFGEALAGVQEGSRNATIFRLAWKLRLEGWGYDESLVLVKTAAGHCEPPLPEDEALRCLDRAWQYDPPNVLSDIGNAERFVACYGDCVRYVPEQERWLVWTGHSWKTNLRAVYRMAKSTIRSLRDEAASEDDPDRKRLLYAYSRKSETLAGIERMLELAALELAVAVEDLDRPGLVAFDNGVYDLSAGTFRPGRREDLLTKHAPFPYDPANHECLQWLERNEPHPAGRPAPTAAAQRCGQLLDSWLSERCDVGPGFSSKSAVLHKDFVAWAGEEISSQLFGKLLVQKGFSRRKSYGSLYEGLQLRDSTA